MTRKDLRTPQDILSTGEDVDLAISGEPKPLGAVERAAGTLHEAIEFHAPPGKPETSSLKGRRAMEESLEMERAANSGKTDLEEVLDRDSEEKPLVNRASDENFEI